MSSEVRMKGIKALGWHEEEAFLWDLNDISSGSVGAKSS